MAQRAIISISLSPDRAEELREAVAQEGITVSEFLRDAVAQKLRANQWKKIRRKGAKTAKKFKISNEDQIEAIVDEFRE